ncbi:NADH-quinone oxidoreductase subunit K [Olivibacter sitiensis]|uniref:NADH-quinone oxidoreductase subunit K n=1 Tax=Olivibacter sitiensis TaxID=376470 RepID=UPI00041ADBA5|nr:NADH-quinone oxidoreductase subunit K [Olivibacter sitiensis]
MGLTLSIVTGFLMAGGVYLLLHKSFMKMITGIIVFGNAINMFLLIAGGLIRDNPPFVSKTQSDVDALPLADPVPQAFILTAIVIGLGVQAFAIVLFKRVYQTSNINDVDELNHTDKIENGE